MVEKMFNGAATAKGAVIITPEKVIVTTPGTDNKKEILDKTFRRSSCLKTKIPTDIFMLRINVGMISCSFMTCGTI